MKNRKEQLTHEDAELFRQAVADATPLPPSGQVAPSSATASKARPPSPVISTTPRDSLSDHGAGDEPLQEFLRPSLAPALLRKLRRGQPPVQDSLDLHGLSSDEARKLLQFFLHEATLRNLRCVRVIHGKGWQAGGGEGVLKIRTRHWLTQCPEVLAFCEAPFREGGGGAVIVLLRQSAATGSGKI